jgi:hypothetical protein
MVLNCMLSQFDRIIGTTYPFVHAIYYINKFEDPKEIIRIGETKKCRQYNDQNSNTPQTNTQKTID